MGARAVETGTVARMARIEDLPEGCGMNVPRGTSLYLALAAIIVAAVMAYAFVSLPDAAQQDDARQE